MPLRGIRGANVVKDDSPEAIRLATLNLLDQILKKNPTLRSKDIACCIFTATPDILTEYPAKMARDMGWNEVPLICTQEMNVDGSMKHCIRVLILWNTKRKQRKINNVYIGEAKSLRPDLTSPLRIG